MYSFKTFLTEATKSEDDGKLKHITHAEDWPILNGSKGFKHAVDTLNHAHNHIKSGGKSSALTMKYDGSPALVFGHHPETGKFFVATKSAFNKNPKINYTDKDIEKNHGHAPGLAAKLHSALKHLNKIAPKTGVYQGDLMFSDNDDEGEGRKEGKGGKISFKPNTITYTAGGDEAEKVRKAKLGVVVHQQYHGDTVENMKADPHPDTHNFKQHPDVWTKSPEYDTRQVHYSEEAQKEYQKHIAAAQALHTKHGKEMYDAIKPHAGEHGLLSTYINSTVRSGEKPSAEGFRNHIQGVYDKLNKTKPYKTPASQGRRDAEMKSNLDWVKKHKNHYDNFFKMHGHLQAAKQVLVDTLDQHEGGLEHHIDGKRSKPEGYVSNHAGQPTKLVNRAEFARANLLKVRKPAPEEKPKEKETKKKTIKVDYENDPQ
jgi:hypothetical protein